MELGRRFDHAGLELDALGYLGKALVERGDVADGMAMIDRSVAAITSGLAGRTLRTVLSPKVGQLTERQIKCSHCSPKA